MVFCLDFEDTLPLSVNLHRLELESRDQLNLEEDEEMQEANSCLPNEQKKETFRKKEITLLLTKIRYDVRSVECRRVFQERFQWATLFFRVAYEVQFPESESIVLPTHPNPIRACVIQFTPFHMLQYIPDVVFSQ